MANKIDENEVAARHGGDAFYGSLPEAEHEANDDVTVDLPHEFWIID